MIRKCKMRTYWLGRPRRGGFCVGGWFGGWGGRGGQREGAGGVAVDLGQTLGRPWVFGRAIPGWFSWILGDFSENNSARWLCRYKMVDFTIRKQHLGGSCQIGVPSGPSERKNLDSKCSYKTIWLNFQKFCKILQKIKDFRKISTFFCKNPEISQKFSKFLRFLQNLQLFQTIS